MLDVIEKCVQDGFDQGDVTLWRQYNRPHEPISPTQCFTNRVWVENLVRKTVSIRTGYVGEIMVSAWLIDEIHKEINQVVKNTLPYDGTMVDALDQYLKDSHNHHSVLCFIVEDRYLPKPKRTGLKGLWDKLFRK